MEKVKHILKNDQNNHLADQVLKFEKASSAMRMAASKIAKPECVESLSIDIVTSSYVRGYN